MWTKGRVIRCLRSGLERAAKRWKEEERGTMADMQPEEFVLHLGRRDYAKGRIHDVREDECIAITAGIEVGVKKESPRE